MIIDSGKDQWEDDAHGLEIDFTDLAANLQTAAHELGATADQGLPRFAQLFLDAADVTAVRAFWLAALGYTHDRRAGVSDIHDPQRLNSVLVFQELDAAADPSEACDFCGSGATRSCPRATTLSQDLAAPPWARMAPID